jgi:hypothetical protein
LIKRRCEKLSQYAFRLQLGLGAPAAVHYQCTAGNAA